MKLWRVYFHRGGDYPMVWCVDEGSIASQIWVQDVLFDKVIFSGETRLTPRGKKKARANEPLAWFEGYANMKIEAGKAIFTQ